MKNQTFILLIIYLMIFTVGCSHSDEKYIPPDEIARLQSVDIMNYILNKDTESLEEMFSKTIRDRHDVKSEIESIYDFIDGEIISYDEPNGSVFGSSSNEEGIYEETLGGDISNIKTDNNRTYYIGFRSYYIYKEDEDMVGIKFIIILDEDSYSETKGYKNKMRIGGNTGE